MCDVIYEIVRWVTLVILWGCIALNVWTLIRSSRTHKKLKEACAVMEKLIKDREKDHAELEEDFDGRND